MDLSTRGAAPNKPEGASAEGNEEATEEEGSGPLQYDVLVSSVSAPTNGASFALALMRLAATTLSASDSKVGLAACFAYCLRPLARGAVACGTKPATGVGVHVRPEGGAPAAAEVGPDAGAGTAAIAVGNESNAAEGRGGRRAEEEAGDGERRMSAAGAAVATAAEEEETAAGGMELVDSEGRLRGIADAEDAAGRARGAAAAAAAAAAIACLSACA